MISVSGVHACGFEDQTKCSQYCNKNVNVNVCLYANEIMEIKLLLL